MTTIFVSRHTGACEWAALEGIPVDKYVAHFDVGDVLEGDVVIGMLSVHVAAEVCARRARYIHVSLDMPEDARGQELSAEMMRDYGARLESYHVERTNR